MIAGDFAPGFYIKHYLKDMGIALDEADQRGLSLEVLRLVEGMYRELRARGMEDSGNAGAEYNTTNKPGGRRAALLRAQK